MSDELMQELVSALIKMSVVVIPILFAILTKYAVKILNAKAQQIDTEITVSKNIQLRDFADLVVDAAEQLVPLDTGEKRIIYAKMQLQYLARGIGIEISDRDTIALIEGALGAIKREILFYPVPQMEELEEIPHVFDGNGI